MPEALGRRIAQLRAQHGYTQQELANRLAISRVAVSHLEAGISTPSERTITLLAGLFKLDPPALIADTYYPEAKLERLPLVACRYTEAELHSRLLANDLEWLERLRGRPEWQSLALDICQRWLERLQLVAQSGDVREQVLVAAAREQLQAIIKAALMLKREP